MTELSTEDIDCLLKCLLPTNIKVLGVHPADEVPTIPNLAHNYCFVLNTDPAHQPGRHWLAFHYNGRDLEYFDSYGEELDTYPHVSASIRASGLTCVRVNTATLQSLMSTVCGHWCVFFLLWRARYISKPAHVFGTVFSRVRNTASKRDEVVVREVRALVDRSRCCPVVASRSANSQSCRCHGI